MNEPKVVWGDRGFATSSGWQLVFVASQQTGEYLTSQEVWVSVGTGLSAGEYLDPPPQPESGKAIVRGDDGWQFVEDHRGEVAYDKQTRQEVMINAIGSLSLSFTFTAPTSQFDVWSEASGCWVKDSQSEQDWLTQQASYQRSALLSEASNEIAALLDALDPEVISDPDDAVQAKLLEWKKYRADLAVIDCTSHPVQWPVKPV